MQRSIFYKLFSGLMLVVFCGENFDFLILMMVDPSPTRPSHHEKCYCSECYASHEGCLCWENPEASKTPEAVATTDVFYKACNCSPQKSGGIPFVYEVKCLLCFAATLAPGFPTESDWPEDKLFFLTDLFAPPVFRPPEVG